MRRYWISREDVADGYVHLNNEIFHHICVVCRQRRGDRFEVIPEGHETLLVELVEVCKRTARARVLSRRAIPPLAWPRLHLALSVSKWNVMDAIVEKMVELGIVEVHPFVSDYSFVRDARSVSVAKTQRWRKIVVSATQQSGRGELMAISPTCSLDELLRLYRESGALGVLPYEGDAALGIKEYFAELATRPRDIWVFVGSEGGFSMDEIQLFRSSGLEPVTLGSQVLRVETACVALMSVIKYEFDLMVPEAI